jgi:GTPase SAR1 family protein
MVIVEGPDGAGKTTLIRQLAHDTEVPVHEKAVPSTGPDPRTLWDWTHRDMANWGDEVYLYDRHPLVSEYIYGPVIRGHTAEGFDRPSAHGLRLRLEGQCLLILCLPPAATVRANVANEEIEQMDGVFDRIDTIYGLYNTLRATWNGWYKLHDYTDPASYLQVLMAARMHIAQWRRASA